MKKYFSFLLLLLTVSFISAQEITITGTITDKEGNEMPGVNVVILGSSFGVTSDVNGDYSITTENKESLQLGFSFIGYEKKNILVAIVHPGLVSTRMTGFTKNGISPEVSAKGILEIINNLSSQNTGTFWHSNGETLPF